jgi:hypothetical protein
MRHNKRLEAYRNRLGFLIQRLNEINEWRNEAVKHAVTKEAVEAIDARALALREVAERG